MSRYKAYGEYKDSETIWFENIPKHWNESRLKFEASINMGQSPNSEDCNQNGVGMPFLQGNAEFGAKNPTPKQYCEIPRKIANPGELLFSVRAPVGALNFADQRYGIGRGLCSIINRKRLDRNFLWWLVVVIKGELDSVSTGSTFEAVSAEQVGNVLVFCPLVAEQEKIANFLDHETAKIDTLIAKQQELIKLLKEKRQAVISHAVTKGLNPNAPMRDSGVGWLGEVPAHWNVKRIGSLFSESNARANSAEELQYQILSVSIHHGISDKELNEEELDRKVTRSDDKSLYKIVHQNDLAYNMMRAWQGGFGASTLSGLVSPAYVVCKPKTELNSFYFELVLRTSSAVTELKRYSRGITDFRLRLYWDEFKTIEVPVPPKAEAAEILRAILKINTAYDNLVIVAEKQIKLLNERRTALISAAVTGKIDVRDWEPALAPELEDAAA